MQYSVYKGPSKHTVFAQTPSKAGSTCARHDRGQTLFQKLIASTISGCRLIFPLKSKFTLKFTLTLHISYPRLTDFQNFPGPVVLFQDFSVLENAIVKFQAFPDFPGLV